MIPKSIIEEIHNRLCDQKTGEPTGLNQALDEILKKNEALCAAALEVMSDVPTLEEIGGPDPTTYTIYSARLRHLESTLYN